MEIWNRVHPALLAHRALRTSKGRFASIKFEEVLVCDTIPSVSRSINQHEGRPNPYCRYSHLNCPVPAVRQDSSGCSRLSEFRPWTNFSSTLRRGEGWVPQLAQSESYVDFVSGNSVRYVSMPFYLWLPPPPSKASWWIKSAGAWIHSKKGHVCHS